MNLKQSSKTLEQSFIESIEKFGKAVYIGSLESIPLHLKDLFKFSLKNGKIYVYKK